VPVNGQWLKYNDFLRFDNTLAIINGNLITHGMLT